MKNKFNIDDVVYWITENNTRFVNILGDPVCIKPPIVCGFVIAIQQRKNESEFFYTYELTYSQPLIEERYTQVPETKLYSSIDEAKEFLKVQYAKIYKFMLEGLECL